MEDQIPGLVAAVFFVFFCAIALVLLAVFVAGLWKVFTKAGQPGWAAIVPIYNLLLLLRIVGRPDIWILLFLVPGVNVVFQIILALDLAKSFGRDTLFAIGLVLLPVVFIPILGFGQARYLGPQTGATAAAAASPSVPPGPASPA